MHAQIRPTKIYITLAHIRTQWPHRSTSNIPATFNIYFTTDNTCLFSLNVWLLYKYSTLGVLCPLARYSSNNKIWTKSMDFRWMVLIITPLENLKLGSDIPVQCAKRGVWDFTVIINSKYWNVCWGRRLVCLSRNLSEGTRLITITVLSVPGLKRLGCEINHSPPCSANFKNEWS
jgi:hypothetical protein